MSSNSVHVVTGGSKGIGLAIVKELSARPNTIVIATARVPSKSTEILEFIKTHSNVHLLSYDASKRGDAKKFAEATAKIVDGVDILHANAGIFEGVASLLKTPISTYEKHFNVNVFGPIELVQEFYPLLKKRQTRKIVLTSTLGASIGGFAPVPASAYGSSKAALNYIAKAISSELEEEKFISVALHPGIVSTEEAKAFLEQVKAVRPDVYEGLLQVAITPEECAKEQLKTINALTAESNGKFINVDGSDLPY